MKQFIGHPVETLKSLYRIDFKQEKSRLRPGGALR